MSEEDIERIIESAAKVDESLAAMLSVFDKLKTDVEGASEVELRALARDLLRVGSSLIRTTSDCNHKLVHATTMLLRRKGEEAAR